MLKVNTKLNMASFKCAAAILVYSFLYSLLSESVVQAEVYEAVADFNDASPGSDSDETVADLNDVTPDFDSGRYDCNFENDWCSWKQVSVKGKYKWSRHTGNTKTSETGPSGDHTSGSGYYVYAEASGPAKIRDIARVVSTDLPATEGVCLTFWYNRYSYRIVEPFKLILKRGNVENTIWETNGNQGEQWLMLNLTITSKTPFKVIFESVRGAYYRDDIALDDIQFQEGNCGMGKKKPMCGLRMKPLGCFQDSMEDRALGNFLASYRQGLRNQEVFLDWNNYPQSLNRMKCNCAQQAKEAGYKYFGIQYYGECWAGNNAYNKHGESPDCINGKFEICISSKESACTGKEETSYIYELLV